MPPRQPTHSPYPTLTPLFRISRALHFGSASSSRQALLCLLPTNQPTSQPAKSSSDVAPTDKWSALGLPACGHYWSMRFSVFLRSFSRHFLSLFFPYRPSFYTSFHRLSRCSCPIFPPSRMPVFTFYFTSCSFIIFLISRGYPFVRDNSEIGRKWTSRWRALLRGARSNLTLRHRKTLHSGLTHPLRHFCN